MKKIELYDHVLTPTGRFGAVYGFGEMVGEVRVRFINGSEMDFDTKTLTIVDPRLIASAPLLLDQLQVVERYYQFLTESLAWLEGYNTNPSIQVWVNNQRELLTARKRTITDTIKQAEL